MKKKGSVTLIIGGAESGKSAVAERLAGKYSKVVYIATGEPIDGEMRRKIDAHQERRPKSWRTVEALAADMTSALKTVDCDAVLIDSLTTYSARAMDLCEDPAAHLEELARTILDLRKPVFVVTDEVGMAVVPAEPSGRAFRGLLGRINQQIAQEADNVYLVIAGLTTTLKGECCPGDDGGWA